MQRYAFCFKRIYIFSFFYTAVPPQTQFSDPKGTIYSKNRGFFLTIIACIIIPLACGTPPCEQRGELLVAVIEQLFLQCISAVPFPKGDETACCRAGDDCRFAFGDGLPFGANISASVIPKETPTTACVIGVL